MNATQKDDMNIIFGQLILYTSFAKKVKLIHDFDLTF